jgi:hypothetical protein
MMSEYQLTSTSVVIRTLDSASIPDDPNNTDRQAFTLWLAAGNIPSPYVDPAPAQIASVTPRQARLALNAAGLLDTVNTAINASGGTTLITWEYASVIERTDPLISTLGAALSLTPAQIDALFVQAATL